MFVLDAPGIQIDFARKLARAKPEFLAEALSACVREVSLPAVDRELHQYAAHEDLSLLASRGLRGEILFATPCILAKRPSLLGYYRLLLGHSQKSFYAGGTGFGSLKVMEMENRLVSAARGKLPSACRALNKNADMLLRGLDHRLLTHEFLYQLTLLTLGPQWRGGENVARGTSAIRAVFSLISGMVDRNLDKKGSTKDRLVVKGSAKRRVLIDFAADPDITVRTEMGGGRVINQIAIEVKGGRDFSNIHNRIGEAEKSHQKARAAGYTQFWTIVNVRRLDRPLAKRESPTTGHFFILSELLDAKSGAHHEFKDHFISTIGIR